MVDVHEQGLVVPQVRPDLDPLRRAGDDRDARIGRQVHQQLDEGVL